MPEPTAETAVFKTITVNRSIEICFRFWTEQIHRWWPTGHSISGESDTVVIIEKFAGGRFYERLPHGKEHDWGSILRWEPPNHLTISWFLGSGQALPSQVEVNFIPLEPEMTRIEVTHRGPEFIGELWQSRVKIYTRAWETVLQAFKTAV